MSSIFLLYRVTEENVKLKSLVCSFLVLFLIFMHHLVGDDDEWLKLVEKYLPDVDLDDDEEESDINFQPSIFR